jgi:hypothetical protein
MKPPILALLVFAAIVGPAQAAGTFDASGAWITKPDPGTLTGNVPTEAEPIDNKICEAFGPGFTAVAGGTTCIKIGGYVKFGTSFGSSKGGGWTEPPPK